MSQKGSCLPNLKKCIFFFVFSSKKVEKMLFWAKYSHWWKTHFYVWCIEKHLFQKFDVLDLEIWTVEKQKQITKFNYWIIFFHSLETCHSFHKFIKYFWCMILYNDIFMIFSDACVNFIQINIIFLHVDLKNKIKILSAFQ